ncbi:MAG: hypothetical protein HKN34_00935 [Gammaproteobacteria bacterium]|nr:hypothetical protein [Gammaproteobacteria bacterium]
MFNTLGQRFCCPSTRSGRRASYINAIHRNRTLPGQSEGKNVHTMPILTFACIRCRSRLFIACMRMSRLDSEQRLFYVVVFVTRATFFKRDRMSSGFRITVNSPFNFPYIDKGRLMLVVKSKRGICALF